MLLHTSPQQHIKRFIIITVSLTTLFLCNPLVTFAQGVLPTKENTKPATLSKTISNNGLEVSPFLQELDVPKGGSINSKIDLFNHGADVLYISPEPRDFLPGDDGQPKFVPDPDKNDKTFSLSSWVNVNGPKNFPIQPGQKITVEFSVNPPVDAEQGTHYGALLFKYGSKGGDITSSETQQSIGTILLVYYGRAEEKGTDIVRSDKNVYWNNDRVDFLNTFDNTGNVHVKPKGEVHIRNIFGQEVGTAFINRDAANVLPKTHRNFLSTWYPSNYTFGPYIAESIITYGRGRLEARSKIIIWVLPIYYVVIITVLILFLLWYWLKGRHLYKRRVLRKHQEKINKTTLR